LFSSAFVRAVDRFYDDAGVGTPPALQSIVPAIPDTTNGHAATLEDAKRNFATIG
jgi:hypothetical protein